MNKTRTLALAAVLFALVGCRHVVHVVEAPVRTTSHVIHKVVPHHHHR